MEKKCVNFEGEFASVSVRFELGYGLRIEGRFARMTRRSLMTAYHLVCDYADAELGPAGQKFLRIYRFRISMPPKDEKKWGTSLASAAYIGMLSLLTGRAVRTKCCVTGALDGDGTVNKVAGIPQKVAAAVENAQQFIVIPQTNFRDFSALKSIEDQSKLDLPGMSMTCWKCLFDLWP
ncbi:hypothetical protein niasHT_033732 [Heterodera trifolii]|uniref:Lon proteolytic domain-containing protein n=1 Tax=Heterodera trifolii TaxID=157864 RepID=A0ABD2IHV5_9BILA